MDPYVAKKVYGIVHIKEPKTCRMTGHAAQQHVLLECPGVCQLINTMKASIPDHRLDTAIRKFTPAQHTPPISSDSSTALACYINITRSTGAEEVALRHCYGAEVIGFLKGPSKDTFKKARSHFTKNRLPTEIANRPSALVDLAHRFFAEKDFGRPRHRPCSHHVATEKVEESAPICAAASSNRALPTPSRLLEYYPYLSVTWDEKHRTRRRRTRYGQGHTGMDHGTAVAPWSCFDTCALRLTRVRAQPQASIYVTGVCIVFFFFWLESASTRASSALIDCPCRIDHVVVDWSCWKLAAFALQPARVPPHSGPVAPSRDCQ